MNLTPIKANMTELNILNMKILFSYKTPVCAMVYNGDAYQFFQTETKWSATTTRHIRAWLRSYGDPGAQYKPQEYFDNLLSEVKL